MKDSQAIQMSGDGPHTANEPRSQCVVLYHTFTENSPVAHRPHYDWLIEVVPGADLVSFRVDTRPDLAIADGMTPFNAVRINDHRRAYLDYEGSISGARGSIVRCARGVVLHTALSDVSCRFEIVFAGSVRVFDGQRLSAGIETACNRWRFRVT